MNELESIKKTQEEILRRLTVMESYYVVEEDGEDEIMYEEPTTAEQAINAAYSALASVQVMDTTLMSKEDANRIKTITKKSIKILHWGVNEMYDSIFDETKDEENN